MRYNESTLVIWINLMEVIRQRNWTEQELIASGFERFERIKQVVMVRRLSEAEAPKYINTEWGEQLVAEAGYAICYNAGESIMPNLDSYYHWPVEPYIFDDTYRPWDQREWLPTQTEKHLMSLGCKPYYKYASIWAKKLDESTWMQSPEHLEPVVVESGRYLVIGAKGEPYTMSAKEFYSRYAQDTANERETIVQKLLSFFRR
jgi:hypothetical protein